MRRAFTLFELILVMVMILVVAGLASPLVFDALYGDTKLVAAADTVRARWADCRSQAIEEGRPYAFAIIPNTGRFKVEPLEATDPAGQVFDTTGGAAATNLPGLIIEGALPLGVRFGTSDAPVNPETEESPDGVYVVIAVFLPDGSAQEDVEVSFGSGSSSTITIHLRALTGSVTTVRPDQENK